VSGHKSAILFGRRRRQRVIGRHQRRHSDELNTTGGGGRSVGAGFGGERGGGIPTMIIRARDNGHFTAAAEAAGRQTGAWAKLTLKL